MNKWDRWLTKMGILWPIESVAEILSNQYKSVFVVESEEMDLTVLISKLTNCFGVENIFSCLTENSIEIELLTLNSDNACGAYSVSWTKSLYKCFFKAVENYFKSSFIEEYVIKLWKEANVTPIQNGEKHVKFICLKHLIWSPNPFPRASQLILFIFIF